MAQDYPHPVDTITRTMAAGQGRILETIAENEDETEETVMPAPQEPSIVQPASHLANYAGDGSVHTAVNSRAFSVFESSNLLHQANDSKGRPSSVYTRRLSSQLSLPSALSVSDHSYNSRTALLSNVLQRFPLRRRRELSRSTTPLDLKLEDENLGSVSTNRIRIIVDAVVETINILQERVAWEPAKGTLGDLCELLKMLLTYTQDGDDVYSIAESCQRLAIIIQTMSVEVADDERTKSSSKLLESMWALYDFINNIYASASSKRNRGTIRRFLTLQEDRRRDQRHLADCLTRLRYLVLRYSSELGVVGHMSVMAIWRSVKLDPIQARGQPSGKSTYMAISVFLPPKPLLFFGRDTVVQEAADSLLNGRDIALVGTAGIGKTSICRAVFHEARICATFHPRIFLSFQYVGLSTSITYHTFIYRILEALGLSRDAGMEDICRHLGTLTALLSIDSAEALSHAQPAELLQITAALVSISSSTRIIFATRDAAAIPSNMLYQEIIVTGLSPESALQAFGAIYPTRYDVKDTFVKRVVSSLDYHPLSINILANIAKEKQWTLSRLMTEWARGESNILLSPSTSNILLLSPSTSERKDRSLRTSFEISISGPAFYERRDSNMRLLRAVAFFPQGVHRRAISGIESIETTELLCRLSLADWAGDFLKLLAPIRMYVMDAYNRGLPYEDDCLDNLRSYYYSLRSSDVEHANVYQLLLSEMSSNFYHSDVEIHRKVLENASHFISTLSITFPETDSLWQLLELEAETHSYTDAKDSLAYAMSLCLYQMCALEWRQEEDHSALRKLKIAEIFCMEYPAACKETRAICLRLMIDIHVERGNLLAADGVLRSTLPRTTSADDLSGHPCIHYAASRIAFSRGNFREASIFASQACTEITTNSEHPGLVFAHWSNIALQDSDFEGAWIFAEKATESYEDGRKNLASLERKASIEGWAGNMELASYFLEDAKNSPLHIRKYVDAIRGKAYYAAILGRFDVARELITLAEGPVDVIDFSKKELIVTLYVNLLLGDREKTMYTLQRAVSHTANQRNKRWMVILHRTMGEVALLLRWGNEASKPYFRQAEALCKETGLSPRCIYTEYPHWYSPPAQYNGWERFLAGEL